MNRNFRHTDELETTNQHPNSIVSEKKRDTDKIKYAKYIDGKMAFRQQIDRNVAVSE